MKTALLILILILFLIVIISLTGRLNEQERQIAVLRDSMIESLDAMTRLSEANKKLAAEFRGLATDIKMIYQSKSSSTTQTDVQSD